MDALRAMALGLPNHLMAHAHAEHQRQRQEDLHREMLKLSKKQAKAKRRVDKEKSKEKKQDKDGEEKEHDGGVHDDNEEAPQENEARMFAQYRPQRMPHGKHHPDLIVESASLASVASPRITSDYHGLKADWERGAISNAQIETVAYALQQFYGPRLEDGSRAGFFLGDGAGMGKGRQISALTKEMQRHGSRRFLWVSVSNDLREDCRRDLADLNMRVSGSSRACDGPSIVVWPPANKSPGKDIKKLETLLPQGMLFVTYDCLRATRAGAGIKKQVKQAGQRRRKKYDQALADAHAQAANGFQAADGAEADAPAEVVGDEEYTRQQLMEQLNLPAIVKWLQGDKSESGPLIIFDECHKAKNLLEAGSITGVAVKLLQDMVPDASVLYSSATGISEPNNLGYMVRLGTFGYKSINQLIEATKRAGLGACELLACGLKAAGKYLARQLSYQGAEFELRRIRVTPEFQVQYGRAAAFLQVIHVVMEQEGVFGDSKGVKSTYWGAHQRVFRSLLTSAKVPAIAAAACKAFKEGESVVVGLQSTGEACSKRLEEMGDLDGMTTIFSPVERELRHIVDDSLKNAPKRDMLPDDCARQMAQVVALVLAFGEYAVRAGTCLEEALALDPTLCVETAQGDPDAEDTGGAQSLVPVVSLSKICADRIERDPTDCYNRALADLLQLPGCEVDQTAAFNAWGLRQADHERQLIALHAKLVAEEERQKHSRAEFKRQQQQQRLKSLQAQHLDVLGELEQVKADQAALQARVRPARPPPEAQVLRPAAATPAARAALAPQHRLSHYSSGGTWPDENEPLADSEESDDEAVLERPRVGRLKKAVLIDSDSDDARAATDDDSSSDVELADDELAAAAGPLSGVCRASRRLVKKTPVVASPIQAWRSTKKRTPRSNDSARSLKRRNLSAAEDVLKSALDAGAPGSASAAKRPHLTTLEAYLAERDLPLQSDDEDCEMVPGVCDPDCACQVCDRPDNEKLMLLCSGCDEGYHTFCLSPPLAEIPACDWFCAKPDCQRRAKQAARREAKAEFLALAAAQQSTPASLAAASAEVMTASDDEACSPRAHASGDAPPPPAPAAAPSPGADPTALLCSDAAAPDTKAVAPAASASASAPEAPASAPEAPASAALETPACASEAPPPAASQPPAPSGAPTSEAIAQVVTVAAAKRDIEADRRAVATGGACSASALLGLLKPKKKKKAKPPSSQAPPPAAAAAATVTPPAVAAASAPAAVAAVKPEGGDKNAAPMSLDELALALNPPPRAVDSPEAEQAPVPLPEAAAEAEEEDLLEEGSMEHLHAKRCLQMEEQAKLDCLRDLESRIEATRDLQRQGSQPASSDAAEDVEMLEDSEDERPAPRRPAGRSTRRSSAPLVAGLPDDYRSDDDNDRDDAGEAHSDEEGTRRRDRKPRKVADKDPEVVWQVSTTPYDWEATYLGEKGVQLREPHPVVLMCKGVLNLVAVTALQAPANPLDNLVHLLGGSASVAEMTGRSMRLEFSHEDGTFEVTRRVPARDNLAERKLFMDGPKRIAVISDAASTGISLQADRKCANQRRRRHITQEIPWSADKAIQQFGRTHRSNQVSAPIYSLFATPAAGEFRMGSAAAKRIASQGALLKGNRDARGAGQSLKEFDIDDEYGQRALNQLRRELAGNRAHDRSIEVPKIPEHLRCPAGQAGNFRTSGLPPDVQTFYDCVRLWCLSVGVLEGEGKANKPFKVSTFLNRIQGLSLEQGNIVFAYFSSLRELEVDKAKAANKFEKGVVLLKSDTPINAVEQRVLWRHPRPGHGELKLTTIEYARGLSYADACTLMDENKAMLGQRESRFKADRVGFYEPKEWRDQLDTGRTRVVLITGLVRGWGDGGYENVKCLVRHPHNKGATRESWSKYRDNYRLISPAKAKSDWTFWHKRSQSKCGHRPENCRDVECQFKKGTVRLHVVHGTFLQLWPVLLAVMEGSTVDVAGEIEREGFEEPEEDEDKKERISMLSATINQGPLAGQQLTGMLVSRLRIPRLVQILANNQERLTKELIADSRGALTRAQVSAPPGLVDMKALMLECAQEAAAEAAPCENADVKPSAAAKLSAAATPSASARPGPTATPLLDAMTKTSRKVARAQARIALDCGVSVEQVKAVCSAATPDADSRKTFYAVRQLLKSYGVMAKDVARHDFSEEELQEAAA